MKLDENLRTRLNAEIVRAHYTYERYNAVSTFALVYHEKDIELEVLGSFVRVSDRVIRVNENLHFLIYNFTNQDDAYKASRNLISKLDKHFHNATSCIAIDSPSKSDSTHMVMNKLYQILEETKKTSVARIEYEDILDNAF
ncbi:hypothetical protein [Sulfurimonas sp.]|uniref:hypothetical protein n=1 Tax=Sulfurimonas sp. TaxID=2022749 RepID=UPI0035644845